MTKEILNLIKVVKEFRVWNLKISVFGNPA